MWRRIYLREWRQHRGLSVEGLAAKAGVSPAIISLIENRKSAGSPDSLEALARELRIEVGELFDVKPEKGGSILRIWVADEDRAQVQRNILAATTKPR